MSLFSCLIEGRLTASPTTGATRDAREYVQFPIVHRDRYRDHTGKWQDTRALFFEVICWGTMADRARNLVRGDQVLIEAGQLLPYINESDLPALKVHARNISLSMRYSDAYAGTGPRQRRGDIVVTADGERYAADAYPDAVTDRELIHHP